MTSISAYSGRAGIFLFKVSALWHSQRLQLTNYMAIDLGPDSPWDADGFRDYRITLTGHSATDDPKYTIQLQKNTYVYRAHFRRDPPGAKFDEVYSHPTTAKPGVKGISEGSATASRIDAQGGASNTCTVTFDRFLEF